MHNKSALEKWHAIANTFNCESALCELIADDACFYSPVLHAPQIGKDLTVKYLSAAIQVFNGNNFHYINEWTSETSAILEFEATIDGVVINGIDMISWNADNKINQFKVMIRPYKAINLIMRLMGERLLA